MSNEITSEMRGGALVVTLNRPQQGNALTSAMATQLFQILKPVASDRTVRAVMLRGAGGNFMDGLDLSIYSRDVAVGTEQNNELLLPYHSAIREIYAMDKPVIAMVDGHVTGPGLSLMLACDLVIAGRGTIFNAAFTSYAMSPDGGASFFLSRKVGIAKATEILMLSENFDAATAERLNLVNHVVDDEQLQESAFQWLDQLANGPTKAFGAVKRLVYKAHEQEVNAHIALEHTYWGANARSFDFRSAIKGYFSKQPVKYTGA